ncbi:hypothetical protein PV379_03725 [Streptomyces caniscabiei]|uniref:hypothetical protein n=1 Tax=Streptomyces caniscabiei TaxID=2746961 RepID=UPI0029ACF8FE|nr:hypothetical protein [Streptomyces caniscabiei]MDX2776449.1 hypothetical protein [Streptomyces caniscabiei]
MNNDKKERTSWHRRSGTVLFLLGMAAIGFLAQFQIVGVILITTYGVVMLKRKVPVKTTFITVLLTLGMVPMAILAGNWLIAQNFAAYAFLLFVWGVVALTADLQREIHPKK